jgi:transposase InsO family protein
LTDELASRGAASISASVRRSEIIGAYLHAVIDNFSRRILAWRVAETFSPANSVAVLVEASRTATPSETTPAVLADAGVESVNAEVDELITTGMLRRILAFTEVKFSNSMIEAWWRSVKHQWLFLHSLDSVTTGLLQNCPGIRPRRFLVGDSRYSSISPNNRSSPVES